MPPTSWDEALSNARHVCVVGAGTMGRGIAQVALQAGHPVTLVDPDPAQLDAAAKDIGGRLLKRHPQVAAALDSLLVTCESIGGADPHGDTVVVEAVVENLAVKHAVFGEAVSHFGPTCVLATNTSSLSITAIAAGVDWPQRVVGMHFFNPVPAMRLVEVVRGLDTPEELADEIAALAASWGKQVAHVRSAPGFIVNRVARPFYGESLRLLEEGVATHDVIDRVLRDAGGFRMGPFELMDLIGLDVNFTVTRTVWEAFNFDPRFAPSQVQAELVAARRLGRKAGRGFYEHAQDAAAPPQMPLVEPAPWRDGVTVVGADPQLTELAARAGHGAHVERAPANSLTGHLYLEGMGAVVVTQGRTAQAESERLGMPVVVIDRCLDASSASLLAAASTSDDLLAAAAGLLHQADVQLVKVADTPGLVVGRVVSMLINEGWDAVQLGIAEPDDVDTAMTLGTNYPIGPFAWCRRWGAAAVLQLLDSVFEEYRDTRYRPNQALRAKARTERLTSPSEHPQHASA